MENKPVQPMEVFTDPRQISLDQQEASPFTLPLHWGPGISGIAAIKDVWHQGKIFLSSFFYTPEELGLSQEEVSRAPYALFSYVSNVNYAIFYVGNLILLLGRDIIHIHESLPVIQFVSKFILPLTCIVALIDTGLNLERIFRSLSFHKELQEAEIEDFNEVLALLLSKDPISPENEQKIREILSQYESIPLSEHSFSSLANQGDLIQKIQKVKQDHLIQAMRHLGNTEPRILLLRVGKWGLEETNKTIHTLDQALASGMLSPSESKEVESLLENLKIQGQKVRIIHCIVLTSLAILLAGCAASAIGCPFAIPLFIFVLSGVMSFGGWGYGLATLPCQGWKIDFRNLCPTPLVEKLSRHLEPKEKKPLYPLSPLEKPPEISIEQLRNNKKDVLHMIRNIEETKNLKTRLKKYEELATMILDLLHEEVRLGHFSHEDEEHIRFEEALRETQRKIYEISKEAFKKSLYPLPEGVSLSKMANSVTLLS